MDFVIFRLIFLDFVFFPAILGLVHFSADFGLCRFRHNPTPPPPGSCVPWGDLRVGLLPPRQLFGLCHFFFLLFPELVVFRLVLGLSPFSANF